MSHKQRGHFYCVDPAHVGGITLRDDRRNSSLDPPLHIPQSQWKTLSSSAESETVPRWCDACATRHRKKHPAAAAPPRADPRPSPNPFVLDPDDFEHFTDNDNSTRLIVTDSTLHRRLYSESAAESHLGLLHIALSVALSPYRGYTGKPPHYKSDQSATRALIYDMPLVPFDMPPQTSVRVNPATTRKLLHELPPEQLARVDCVLDVIKTPHSPRTVMLDKANLVWVAYQKDDEKHSLWQVPAFNNLAHDRRRAMLVVSPFNPHRFAYSNTSLCALMIHDSGFAGFMSPSLYMKTPDSFFCLHIEQMFAPFYNLAYEGGTTWYAVRREDMQLLFSYIVQRARQWFDVPASEQLSADEVQAIHGMLYTKRLLFHPDDLVAAGIRLIVVKQAADSIVMGLGDVVHFGHVTKPPAGLQPPAPAPSTVRSVNEAVNFLPIEWLTTGLRLHVEWMQWLQQAWVPMQSRDKLTGGGKRWLREAIQHADTNSLIAKHCAPLWSHTFFTRLRNHLTNPPAFDPHTAPTSEVLAVATAIHSFISSDEPRRAGILADIDTVLQTMDERATKRWLLENTDERDEYNRVLTDYYE